MADYHYRAVNENGKQTDVGDYAFWNVPDAILDAVDDGWADDVAVIERARIVWEPWLRRCEACGGSRLESDADCSEACEDCNHGGECVPCDGSGWVKVQQEAGQ